MDWTLEVVVVPVSQLDRATAFCRDQVGFDLDHHTTNEFMDVAQLTPPGSGCSKRDGGTLFGFADPDGNTWAVQQIRGQTPPTRRW